jgi:iron complex transport system ATP-binding protein
MSAVAPATEFAIGARGLSVRLGERTVLNDVDLDLRWGEILAVVGPNGAGKSTLLAALAGDVEPERGTVTIGDAALRSRSALELARLRAVLPQQTSIAFPFTVGEVVSMGRAPWAGTPRQVDDEDAVATAMRETDIGDLGSRRHTELSGGERARVTLARVLAQDTVVLLLDEPTAALDLRHQELVMRVARARARRGDAVLVVVHDLGLAAAHADRVAVLDDGRLDAVGPPAEVLDPDRLSRVYQTGVEVIAHPRTGELLVLPVRRAEER